MMRKTLLLACAALMALGLPLTASAEKAPSVKLLNAGKGRKAKLRVKPKKGDQTGMVMVMHMNMIMSMDGRKLPAQNMPAMEFVLGGQITDVKKNGDIAYHLTVERMRVMATADMPKELAQGLQNALREMEGIQIKGVTTDRGLPVSADATSDKPMTPQLKATLDSMKSSMRQLSNPFPEEAVGVGASWIVHTRLDQNGMAIDQDATMTLKERKGDRIVIAMVLEQKAQPQEIKKQGMPPGVSMRLDSLDGKGTGETVMQLSQMMPTTGDAKVHSTMAMTLTQGAKLMKLGGEIDVKITIRPKGAAPGAKPKAPVSP